MGIDVKYCKLLKPTKELFETFIRSVTNPEEFEDDYGHWNGPTFLDSVSIQINGTSGRKLTDAYHSYALLGLNTLDKWNADGGDIWYMKEIHPLGILFYETISDPVLTHGLKSPICLAKMHKHFKDSENGIYYISTTNQLKAIQRNWKGKKNESLLSSLRILPKYHFFEVTY